MPQAPWALSAAGEVYDLNRCDATSCSNCGSLSSFVRTLLQHDGSARAVGAGQGCGDGASAGRGGQTLDRPMVDLDAVAGVMILSEVAQRLMMMSGSGASTCPAECGRAATSRLTEVTTTAVPAGHRRPVENRARISQDMIRPALPSPTRKRGLRQSSGRWRPSPCSCRSAWRASFPRP